MDKHTIVQDLKRVASELGKSPTAAEYERLGKCSYRAVVRIFGAYSVAVQAAGLESSRREKKLKLDNETVFGRDIETEIKVKRALPEIRALYQFMPSTLFIGDTHFPFVQPDALTAVYSVAERLKPKVIVQVGDLYDMFSHSKFPRSQNVYAPDAEITLACESARTMWQTLKKIAPGAACHQLMGNHDVRPLKRILETYPEAELFLKNGIKPFFEFPGVATNFDSRQELYLTPDTLTIHGYRSGLGDHRDHALMNVICGHTHVGGVSFRKVKGRTLWELNAGYLGDPESKALSYTAQKIVRWTWGVGYVDADGPRFIPFD